MGVVGANGAVAGDSLCGIPATGDKVEGAHNEATNRSASLNNEATSYAAVFTGAAPAPTYGNAAGTGVGGGGVFIAIGQ